MKSFFLFLLSSIAIGSEFDLSLSRPEISLVAQVDANGEIVVRDYPRRWTSRLSVLGPGPQVKFFKDLSEATCREVESFAKQAGDPLLPPMAKERALEITRKANVFLLSLDVGSQLKPNELIAKVREKIDLPTLSLKNPLEIRDVKLTLSTNDKAISRYVKNLNQVEKSWMESFSAGLKSGGVANAEIATMDVLCDLARGNAELIVELTVEEMNRKQTRLLLPLAEAKAASENFQKELKGFDAGNLGNNRVLATLILVDTLRERNFPRPSKEDVILIVEKLTHANGMPKVLSDLEMKSALSIPILETTFTIESPVKLEAK